MLNDGYGNPLSEDSESGILDSYTGWFHRIAATMVRRDDLRYDDVLQEGRIAAWKAIQNHDPERGPLDYWIKRRSHWAMKSAVLGSSYTGEDRPVDNAVQANGTENRDKIRAFLRTNARATNKQISEATGLAPSLVTYHMKRMTHDVEKPSETLLSALMEDSSFDIAAAGDLLEDILSAYHNGEISDALSSLTPNERKYVNLRFWEGLTHTELTDAFGYNPGAIWTQAKKKLKPKLEHLIGV